MPLAELKLARNGMITAWNEDAARLLGPDLEGRRPADLFPGVQELLDETVWTGGGSQGFCVAPVAARAGQALALVCRPMAQDQAWEAFLLPLRGGSTPAAEILSDLLHDLRTPLTTLLGASELLESGHLGSIPERAAGIIKVATGAAQQIAGMLENASVRRAASRKRKKNERHHPDS
jgi:signal transduction histidine kinase